ncbi:cytochrome bd ubiquinol oxidase [Rickenella mellea]|uniref:Complex III subunit 7 n=1 Tax=Rickenella mellea TaxID=50990 RepID=A0A4Y7QKL0_9AGAM|nr:cytochrome bd ubiquinol oxidase [Rickenella mellea]
MNIFKAGPLGPSLAPRIRRSKSLFRWIKPLAEWYANIAGYRQMGLRYDDLIVEERPDVKKAISRLPAKEAYDREYRFRLASQCSIVHKSLPKEQWVKPEDDVRYLTPHIEEVVKEDQEREKWDTIAVERK